MSTSLSPMEQVTFIAKLADLEEAHYEQMTLLHALMEILLEKQLVTAEELSRKLKHLKNLDQRAIPKPNQATPDPTQSVDHNTYPSA